MGKGVALTAFQQGQIVVLRDQGKSLKEIADIIKKSKTVVHNFLRLGSKYGTKKRTGRKPIVTDRNKREIRRLATNSMLSSGDIRRTLNLPVTNRRVRQILEADPNIIYQKRTPHPRLLPRHRDARLAFAEKFQFWEEEWKSVIFSDEKKFNLDGPDGFQYYYRDKRTERQTCKSRNFGGGTLMIWAAFCYGGKSPVCFISTKMNAKKYVELLDNVLIDFGDEVLGENYIFQQDNAAIHTARETKQFFESKGLRILEWPACSPDLNPIENVWGLLSKRVFARGRQYDTVSQLRKSINAEWANLTTNELKSYIESMPRRLQQVIIKKGGNTDY